MTCFTNTAFWTASGSLMLMFIACTTPLWLGRRDDKGHAHCFGLFYRLNCAGDGCTISADVLSSNTVIEENNTWNFDIVVLPVLSALSLTTCAVGMMMLEIMACGCGKHRFSLRSLIGMCAFLFILSGMFGASSVLISFYVASAFYSNKTISEASEFPWSLAIMTIAVLQVLLAGCAYIYIACEWNKYRYDFRNRSHLKGDQKYVINKHVTNKSHLQRRYRKWHLDNGARGSQRHSRYGTSTLTDSAYGLSSFYSSHSRNPPGFVKRASTYGKNSSGSGNLSDSAYYSAIVVPGRSKSLNDLRKSSENVKDGNGGMASIYDIPTNLKMSRKQKMLK